MEIDKATQYLESLRAAQEEKRLGAKDKLKAFRKSRRQDDLASITMRIEEFKVYVHEQFSELEALHSSRLRPWYKCHEKLKGWSVDLGLLLDVMTSRSAFGLDVESVI
ncbi:hypothetical protein VKT23_020685 [Stygiomarasmius scandens]|uniref:Uncharacterized protein n=1 Tax=Marasmiellus scandens TaxID=2682957 RepID=A0ABR1III5_9AGAR